MISSAHVLVITTNVNIYQDMNQGPQHNLPTHFKNLSDGKAKLSSTNEECLKQLSGTIALLFANCRWCYQGWEIEAWFCILVSRVGLHLNNSS